MKRSVSEEIKYGSIISYLLIGINIVLGLVYTPWILRVVGSSNYGLYTLASTLIALFLLDFGMSSAVTRFIAKYRAIGNQEKINSFAGFIVKFYAVICLLIFAVLFVVYLNIDIIYGNLTLDELSSFRIVFIITALFVVICFPVNICNGILNAYEQYISLKFSDIFNKIGTVVVTIIALLFGGGIYALVFINGFFNLITFIVKIFLVYIKTPVKASFRSKERNELKEVTAFSLWTTVQTISNQMIFNLIPTVLAMVTNTAAITMYGFANVIEGYVYNITQAINGLFLPKVSRIIVGENDAKKTLPLMIKVGRVNQSVISILLIGLFVLGKEFVHLWVGDQYSLLYYCILALAFPYFISASQQIANSSLIALNKVKYPALINLVTGIANLVLAYFVAFNYGVVGVCVVIGAIFVLRTVLLNIVYVRVLRIPIGSFFKECHFKMLPGIMLTVVISFLLNHFLPYVSSGVSGWLIFACKTLLICAIYFVVMWLVTWNEFEKELLKSFGNKIGKKLRR